MSSANVSRIYALTLHGTFEPQRLAVALAEALAEHTGSSASVDVLDGAEDGDADIDAQWGAALDELRTTDLHGRSAVGKLVRVEPQKFRLALALGPIGAGDDSLRRMLSTTALIYARGPAPRLVYPLKTAAPVVAIAPFPLAGDRPLPAEVEPESQVLEHSPTFATLQAIGLLAERWSATPESVWLAAYAMLLRRHSEDESYALHAAGSFDFAEGRERLGLRISMDSSLSPRLVLDALRRGIEETHAATASLGFELCLQQLALPGIATVSEARLIACPACPQYLVLGVVVDDDEAVKLRWCFKASIFDRSTIAALGARLEQLIASLLTNEEATVAELDIIPAAEREVLRRLGDGAAMPAWAEQTVLDLIAQRTAASPNAIALRFDAQCLTYAELDTAADHLASYMRAQGVARGAKVALFVDRGLHLVTAVLAIWKAGGVYIPIDPDYPAARIALILEDAEIDILLTESAVQDRLPENIAAPRIDVEAGLRTKPREAPTTPVPNETAYIIYTSGSTGRPKGVRIPHGALAAHLQAMLERPGLRAEDRMLAMTTVSFDISFLEMLLPLVAGAQVVVVPRTVARDPHLLSDALDRHAITVMQATPSSWRLLLTSGWSGRKGLKALTGGEALTPALATELLSRCDRLWNMYGPTEATIWSSVNQVDTELVTRHARDASLPIGGPTTNVTYRIVDVHGQLTPIGVPGELWIGGPFVAEGYHQRPELTRERFVMHEGGRYYRTGDRVRLAPDGAYEYHGRFDHQVKIRGYRIELGEIEVALGEHPLVREAAVIVCNDRSGTPQLVGYIGASTGAAQDLPLAELRDALRSRLPAYMVPSQLIALEQFPMTPSGKIDRKALPTPSFDVLPLVAVSEEAVDAVTQQLLMLWRELLGHPSVGSDDNFFAVGGHSLLAVELARRIEQTFARSLPVHALFGAPTVSQQAALIRGDAEARSRVVDAIKPTGTRPPLFFIGSTGYARALGPVLHPDQPMYGLRIFGLQPEDGRDFDLDLQGIARAFVAALREVQPVGPYHLTAYCDDCKVALIMAEQLCAAGEEVALLAFIDAVWVDMRGRRRLEHYLRNLKTQGARWVARRIADRVRLGLHGLKQVRGRIERKLNGVRGEQPTVLQRDLQLVAAYQRQLAVFPPPYSGDLKVILSDEYNAPDVKSVLQGMTRGSYEVFEVGGLHGDLFRSPYIEKLAKKLVELVAEAERRRCQPAEAVAE